MKKTPTRIEMSHHRIKGISQRKFVIICSKTSLREKLTQTMSAKSYALRASHLISLSFNLSSICESNCTSYILRCAFNLLEVYVTENGTQ